jgi:hypothetical protein
MSRFALQGAFACLMLLASACDASHAERADASAEHGDAGPPPPPSFQHIVREALGDRFGGMWIYVPTGRTKLGVVGLDDKTEAQVRAAAEANHVDTSTYDCVSVRYSFAELTREDAWLSNEIDKADEGASVTFSCGIGMNSNMNALALVLSVPTADMTLTQKALVPRVKSREGDMLRIEYWSGHADPR